MNHKVAILIPTMNRPDFILRQLRFYELMNSPHPVYIVDSSDEQNAKKIKDGIKQFTKISVTYQWALPGKDPLYSILSLVKEKYCTQIGDEDFIIPEAISECADFLENNPDYATCKGKQVNFHFKKDDDIKPYGIIERQAKPIGRSIEDGDMFIRTKKYWADQTFLGLTVRRIEIERSIRNITQHLPLMGDLTEFLIMSILITSGKAKVIDRLGFIMQISDLRSFDHSVTANFTSIGDDWNICEEGFAEILHKKGVSKEESPVAVKGIFIIYLSNLYVSHLFSMKIAGSANSREEPALIRQSLVKNLKRYIARWPLFKRIYYKFNPPEYVDMPESKYYHDFKLIKDFLESR